MHHVIRGTVWVLSLGLVSAVATSVAAAQAPRGPVIVPSAVTSPVKALASPEGPTAMMRRMTMPPLTRAQYEAGERRWMRVGMVVGLVAGIGIVMSGPASKPVALRDFMLMITCPVTMVSGALVGSALFEHKYGPHPPTYPPPPDIVPRDMSDRH